MSKAIDRRTDVEQAGMDDLDGDMVDQPPPRGSGGGSGGRRSGGRGGSGRGSGSGRSRRGRQPHVEDDDEE